MRLPIRAAVRNSPQRPSCAVAIVVLLVAGHLALVASVFLQERPIIWPIHNDTVHRVGRAADFYAVYHAGMNSRLGISPYDNNFDGITPYWYPFRYLPVVATAAQAFTVMSPRAAYGVWIFIMEGLLAFLLVALWNRIDNALVRCLAIGILLLNSPYFLEVYMGQFTFASIVLCCLALLLPAGRLLFCLSVLVKPLTLITLPALAALRRCWSRGAWAIVCVAVLSLPYFVRHPEQWSVFVNVNFRTGGGLDTGNYGFVRFLSLLADDGGALFVTRHWTVFIGAFRAATLAACALLVLHSRKKSALVGAAALLLAHFLTYQHVWEHHMSGVCVLGAAVLTAPGRRRSFTVAVLASLFLLALPTPFVFLDAAKDPAVWDPSAGWPRYALYLLVLSKAAPTLALFVSSVAYLCQDGLMSPREAFRSAFRNAPGKTS